MSHNFGIGVAKNTKNFGIPYFLNQIFSLSKNRKKKSIHVILVFFSKKKKKYSDILQFSMKQYTKISLWISLY